MGSVAQRGPRTGRLGGNEPSRLIQVAGNPYSSCDLTGVVAVQKYGNADRTYSLSNCERAGLVSWKLAWEKLAISSATASGYCCKPL